MSHERRTVIQEVTTVRKVFGSFGKKHTNPLSLGQIREFVALCDGLDDETSVNVEKGSLSESGRYTYTLSVRIVTEPSEGGSDG